VRGEKRRIKGGKKSETPTRRNDESRSGFLGGSEKLRDEEEI